MCAVVRRSPCWTFHQSFPVSAHIRFMCTQGPKSLDIYNNYLLYLFRIESAVSNKMRSNVIAYVYILRKCLSKLVDFASNITQVNSLICSKYRQCFQYEGNKHLITQYTWDLIWVGIYYKLFWNKFRKEFHEGK